jgi:hypothetical protein
LPTWAAPLLLTCLSPRKKRRPGVHLLIRDFWSCLAVWTLLTHSTVVTTACCNACSNCKWKACSWTPFSQVVSAALPTASALRPAAPSTRASGCLRTRWANRSLTSSFLLPCVCASACPLFRSRCLLSALCAKPWHALACSAVRRRAVTTRHDGGMQLLVRFARSNGVLARFEPKDMGSRVYLPSESDNRRHDRSPLSCPVPSPRLSHTWQGYRAARARQAPQIRCRRENH